MNKNLPLLFILQMITTNSRYIKHLKKGLKKEQTLTLYQKIFSYLRSVIKPKP